MNAAANVMSAHKLDGDMAAILGLDEAFFAGPARPRRSVVRSRVLPLAGFAVIVGVAAALVAQLPLSRHVDAPALPELTRRVAPVASGPIARSVEVRLPNAVVPEARVVVPRQKREVAEPSPSVDRERLEAERAVKQPAPESRQARSDEPHLAETPVTADTRDTSVSLRQAPPEPKVAVVVSRRPIAPATAPPPQPAEQAGAGKPGKPAVRAAERRDALDAIRSLRLR